MTSENKNSGLIRDCVLHLLDELNSRVDKNDDYSAGTRLGIVLSLSALQNSLADYSKDDKGLKEYGLDIDLEEYI